MRRQRGKEPPEQYYTRPVFDDPHIASLQNAFQELSSERQVGMSSGPIPISKIREHVAVEFDGLSEDHQDRIVDVLRLIDAGWRALESEKSPAQPSAEGAAAPEHPVKRMLKGLAPPKDAAKRKKR